MRVKTRHIHGIGVEGDGKTLAKTLRYRGGRRRPCSGRERFRRLRDGAHATNIITCAAARSLAYGNSWRKEKKADAFSSYAPPPPHTPVDNKPKGNTTVITDTIAKQKQRRQDTTFNGVFRRSIDSGRDGGEGYTPFSRQFSTTQSAVFSPGNLYANTMPRRRRQTVWYGLYLRHFKSRCTRCTRIGFCYTYVRTSDRCSYSCSAVYNVCVCGVCARARQTGGTTLCGGRSSLAIKHGRHARARDVRRTMVPHRLAATEVSTTRHCRRRRSNGRDESAGGGGGGDV